MHEPHVVGQALRGDAAEQDVGEFGVVQRVVASGVVHVADERCVQRARKLAPVANEDLEAGGSAAQLRLDNEVAQGRLAGLETDIRHDGDPGQIRAPARKPALGGQPRGQQAEELTVTAGHRWARGVITAPDVLRTCGVSSGLGVLGAREVVGTRVTGAPGVLRAREVVGTGVVGTRHALRRAGAVARCRVVVRGRAPGARAAVEHGHVLPTTAPLYSGSARLYGG